MPKIELTLKKIKDRLAPLEYLNTNGLYNALHLQQLTDELDEIYYTARDAHKKNPSKETQDLLKEVDFLIILHYLKKNRCLKNIQCYL